MTTSDLALQKPSAGEIERLKRDKLFEICRRDLLTYVRTCDQRYVNSRLYGILARHLEDVAHGTCRRLILTLPPRTGKSRLTAVEFATWMMGLGEKYSIVCASYSGDLSAKHSREARARILNPLYSEMFGGVTLAAGNTAIMEWSLSNGSSYKAVGVGGSLTGQGARCLIIDDPLRDFAEAHSSVARENVWQWYLSVARTRLSPGGVIIIIMSRWHVGDLVGRLLDPVRIAEMREMGVDPGEEFRVVNLPAIANQNDPIGRAEGEALVPERYPLKELQAIRATLGSHLWGALYQGNPTRMGGNYINSEWFRSVPPDSIPTGLRWMRFWDLATSEKSIADYTAGVAGAMDADGNLWLRDMIFGQWEWPYARTRIISTALVEKIAIGVEAVGGFKTSFSNLKEKLEETAPGREIVAWDIGVEKDKLTRALPWIALAEARKVRIVAGEWNQAFFTQCEEFPRGENDDIVDAVSGVYGMLANESRPILI